ncbi:hypothetical protein MED92_14138 [Oceanospirillum sp. MED92]|uniref:Uncharacterized protein n=1 Tax=Neptuniibacter caesariensis TaxID=207954 RepID=A0A7U8C1Z5_NEPCE|nr:hypothetical protein MED92_14138 [Oceanospirillum sp. MED92] [Neptuniibacter caesariensis]
MCAKVSAVECLDLFKLTDKADSRYTAHPAGLAEQVNRFVNNFRQATSMTVIIAARFICSVSLSRIGLVRRFLTSLALFIRWNYMPKACRSLMKPGEYPLRSNKDKEYA